VFLLLVIAHGTLDTNVRDRKSDWKYWESRTRRGDDKSNSRVQFKVSGCWTTPKKERKSTIRKEEENKGTNFKQNEKTIKGDLDVHITLLHLEGSGLQIAPRSF
jgi:hypothetical protein